MTKISVILCTHNPRREYLQRVLAALKEQTLPPAEWELLLMDNASKEPLAGVWNVSWHPHAQIVREEKLGKTHAVLHAIRRAKGEILMTVDDDNVLDPRYLENTVRIGTEHPFLGAWGASLRGEFEGEVPGWIKPYLHALAVREVDRDYWSNYHADNRSMPVGAGLCVRRHVALAYAEALRHRPASQELDRKGTSLISGGDIDLAMTAYDCGLGTAVFQRLQITHLIPRGRLTVDYVCRLLEGIEYSTHLLRSQRNPGYQPPQENSALMRWIRAYQVWRLPEPVKSFVQAENRGLAQARQSLEKR